VSLKDQPVEWATTKSIHTMQGLHFSSINMHHVCHKHKTNQALSTFGRRSTHAMMVQDRP